MSKIAIIGAGNMGGAIFKALLKTFPAEQLAIADHSQAKIAALKKFAKNMPSSSHSGGASHFSANPNDILKNADVIIVAVKPQSFAELVDSLTVSLKGKLIISIMAGISLSTLQQKLQTPKIVRSMPNLPTQVNAGLTGWIASKKVSSSAKKLIRKIFKSFGEEIELHSEKDIITLGALSGCGPAYFFYLCELMMIKAEKFGFNENDARTIAEKTFIGAAKLLAAHDLKAADWRKAVSSKKGITVEAIKALQRNGFHKVFFKGIDRAKKRTEEMSKMG